MTITLFNIFQLYRFFIELSLFCVPFCVRLPHRNRFGWRLGLGILGCVLLSSVWNHTLSSIPILVILRYLVLFAAVTAGIRIVFDCSGLVALSCAMGGYASQHLYHKLSDIAEQAVFRYAPVLRFVLFFAIFAGTMLLVWFLFARNLTAENYRAMENRKNTVLCGLVLLCTIFFSFFYVKYADVTVPQMLIVCSLYDCVCCGMALWIQFGMFELNRAKEEAAVVEQLWRQEKKRLALSRETVDLINIKCHDMKHLLSHMERDSAMKDLQELIEIYDCSVDTDNDILNLILAEKSLVCRDAGIHLNCIADGKRLEFMEESDIYSLFGNAIDNAITAVQRIADKDKRVVTLTVKSALGMVSVCIENYFEDELVFESGLPKTSKADKNEHGYGLKSIQYLVRKYGGEMTIKTENDIFTLTLLLPEKN